MRFRLLNKLYANLFGYFWLPCPLCGQYFGGHEWKTNSEFKWAIKIDENRGEGICSDCIKRGLGNYPS